MAGVLSVAIIVASDGNDRYGYNVKQKAQSNVPPKIFHELLCFDH
jgi:hypothetical protein